MCSRLAFSTDPATGGQAIPEAVPLAANAMHVTGSV